MRNIIKHILKEESANLKLINIINTEGIFSAADMVGGLDNLKKILKDNPEIIKKINSLGGEITIYDPISEIGYPFEFEVINIHKNVWRTNSWPQINVVYDESKLNDQENEILREFIIDSENEYNYKITHKTDNSMFNVRDMVDINQINGRPVSDDDRSWVRVNSDKIDKIMKKLHSNKQLSESTFFRRRVDMSLMDKEFFEILNYVANILITKHDEGKIVKFPEFKNRVIDYLIDNYHGELSDWGNKEYPYDEVYEFLSNHFNDKIKEKYDLMFDRNINESKKEGSLLSIIKDIVEPFKEKNAVCGIDVNYDQEDDMYTVMINFEIKNLDKIIHPVRVLQREWYVDDIRKEVKNEIIGLMSIKNIYVGSTAVDSCDETMNESIKKILREEEQRKTKTNEFQKLIDDEIESMKEICEQMGADDEEIISFDACDFLELNPKVIVTDVDKFNGKLRILVVIKYEDINFHDEESFIYELQWRLKWVGNVMIDVEDVINTYPNDKRQW